MPTTIQTQAPAQPSAQPHRTRVPASWRRFATRPRSPITGLSTHGPWASLRPHALRLLRHDQARIRRMARALERARTGGERARLLARLEGEMAVHSRVEHEVFYPAYRNAATKARQRKAYHECVEMHRAVELHLADLRRVPEESVRFAGRARTLRIAAADLFREEARRLFPLARRLLGHANLRALGRSMQDHRRALLRNPRLEPLAAVRAAA